MATFKGLSDDEARLEFALELLHTMPEHEEKAVTALFDEAEKGNLFTSEVLSNLRIEALELTPRAELFYGKGREADLTAFQNFRDKVLGLANMT